MITRIKTLLFLGVLTTVVVAEETQIASIDIITDAAQEDTTALSYATSQNTESLAHEATGQTLGDFLSGKLGVDSASYGPAVGRPTIRGMEGYRVGISQGGVMLNDLSAMSQDHAVGLNAKVTERIEMIKGPASLLYGSYSGGIIRTLGEEHLAKLLKKGFSLDTSIETNTNTQKGTGSFKGAYATDTYELYLNYYNHAAKSYQSEGETVPNSDSQTEQIHGVLGWKYSPNTLVKVYADRMDKEYGIPNQTPERTDILMEQQRYGIVVHQQSLQRLKNVMTEFQVSDYRHYEREDGRYDGLFDQQQRSLSSQFDMTLDQSTEANFRLELLDNILKVCHEHGQCDQLRLASRTEAEDGLSLLNYYDTTGIPFSHGHPMPDTQEKKVTMALNVKRFYSIDEISLATNIVARNLVADSANIQETWLMHPTVDPDYYRSEDKAAFSLSLGWWRHWSDQLSTQASLAYIERLPSAQELYWNGFHHATESYILGDRDLAKERSVNLDMDLRVAHTKQLTSRVSAYYYDFANYIYQSPLVDSSGTQVYDPYHGSAVWEMRGVGARIYGFGLEEHYVRQIHAHHFKASAQFSFLKGELKEGGYIPRMAPYNATLSLEHDYQNWHNDISVKWVDQSRNEADNETSTDGYTMLNLSTRYRYRLSDGYVEAWVKGQNLTDELARNHLSFLKESAPLPGRAVIFGMSYHY